MPRCGNCKGHHATIEEVRQCYAKNGRGTNGQGTRKAQRSSPPAHVLGRGGMATANQLRFVEQLLEQTNKTEVDVLGSRELKGVTFDEADDLIKRLKAERDEVRRSRASTELPATLLATNPVPDGTYTVVFDETKDDRITLRFRAPTIGKWKGVQLVSFLSGPDNTSDYTRAANWTDGGYRLWSRFREEDGRIALALKYLVLSDDEQRRAAGMTYALASGNCYRCGRTLTVPVSIGRGLGPDCAAILGVA